MEMQLKKEPLSYLEPVVCSGRELEQTQQIRLPEGMPDIGKVLGVWGQSVLRSKEWRSDGVSVSGGVLVWVLYVPEDGSRPRALDGWIGFQGKWDLPEGSPDGTVLVQPVIRSLDARSVSPRKLLVRVGLGVGCMALCGLCTDICVISNAMILKSAFPEARVSVDSACCAGVTEESHNTALNAMRAVQIEVK